MTDEAYWTAVLGPMTEGEVRSAAADQGQAVEAWVRAAVAEAERQGARWDTEAAVAAILGQMPEIESMAEAVIEHRWHMVAPRYEVRVLQGSADDRVALSGPVVGTADTEEGARLVAEDVAMDYHYGVVIVDLQKDLYDWGEGWRREDGEEPGEETTYEVVRYAADGHEGEQDPADPSRSDGAVVATGTLDECRDAIADLLGEAAVPCPECRGTTDRGRQAPRWDDDLEAWVVYRGAWVRCPACAGTGLALGWSGLSEEGDVEAYHESWAEGCGGWAIRRAAPTA